MNIIASIVGARPQFIKLAPLSRALKTRYEEIVVHTGQHFDDEMSKLIFEDLGIPHPDYNLEIRGGTHGEQTGRMLTGLEKLLIRIKPDLVIVFGDTNTTLAGTLAAAKLNIKSVHIEAGLRSFNRTMPEEINRVVADHACDYLFAPTRTAMDNLVHEGLGARVYLTGDIMVDSLELGREIIRRRTADGRRQENGRPTAYGRLIETDDQSAPPLPRILRARERGPGGEADRSYHLLTLHRPYNVDDPENLAGILVALEGLEQPVIFPVHPRTRSVIEKNHIRVPSNISLIKPQGYLDFIQLQENAVSILTDSGGIQKEAYILGTPCITLRPETEWIETVEAGRNLLLDRHDPHFIKKIREFSPSTEKRPIFGVNVSTEMLKRIEEILGE